MKIKMQPCMNSGIRGAITAEKVYVNTGSQMDVTFYKAVF
jgi:hypothetical protein